MHELKNAMLNSDVEPTQACYYLAAAIVANTCECKSRMWHDTNCMTQDSHWPCLHVSGPEFLGQSLCEYDGSVNSIWL